MQPVGKQMHAEALPQSAVLLLGLGANVSGRWGTPRETLDRALSELKRAGIAAVRASSYYSTDPVGNTPQPRYLNAVVLARAHIAPGELLRLLKRIERSAGRKAGPAMSSRPLDIDILDYGGRRIGWPPSSRRERSRLILPHPEMHRRAFVLVPLLEVAPFWRHPVLRQRANALAARLTRSARSDVRQALDSARNTCDKVSG